MSCISGLTTTITMIETYSTMNLLYVHLAFEINRGNEN